MNLNKLSSFEELSNQSLSSITGGDNITKGLHKFGRFLRDTTDNAVKAVCGISPWC
ncbi:TPA: ComC/BlpC family leader-containing pheromone/bacteriocin [Streptococcus suis]|uniref:ComC/BlpC family leader-containing pheromone/bacteriocin n=1 Tax=Streptococcus TaxID=1301 RepID=UPI00040A63EF|nr:MULTISPECIES: ComC/BlpC family leader-containing pheromone/bacteriocin [Streptococcus]MDG4508535.1 ComC/BlpC family leader-containing pheromone/bacteriocin [Streptococcus suis]NQK82376.1 ComC/BlpC family leader-containing pheromone/bacteriocin [Streptococcus suis]HEM4053565.1 ComC/BlpC family leader-containing pheromone/bacteriocin [Streptococcus suis]HEM4672447.1 ComC/BlpC family leader-containing pheromone/bacteriocin [Streptococcus suis]HEM6017374.1 ComC/BlpC family leader-containing phe